MQRSIYEYVLGAVDVKHIADFERALAHRFNLPLWLDVTVTWRHGFFEVKFICPHTNDTLYTEIEGIQLPLKLAQYLKYLQTECRLDELKKKMFIPHEQYQERIEEQKKMFDPFWVQWP